MVILTAAHEAWDLSHFRCLKLIRRPSDRGEVVMLAGIGVSNEIQPLAFFPRDAIKDAVAILAEIAEYRYDDKALANLTGRTVDPDEQMLADAGLTDQPPEPELPPGPRFFRLRLGSDTVHQLRKLVRRRISAIDFGGDGTIAIFTEGPHE